MPLVRFPQESSASAMPSEMDVAKRNLVRVLTSLARKYGVHLALTRDSTPGEVQTAYRSVARKAHPDKGGSNDDFQRLSAANDVWQELHKKRTPVGRPPKASATRNPRPSSGRPFALVVPDEQKEFRIRSRAFLLTYQRFPADVACALSIWVRFVDFVERHVRLWCVRHWTATAESNEDGTHHFHLMLQVNPSPQEKTSRMFVFDSVLPNASTNDLLGEGFGGKRYQASWDRGQFYAWANKRGTMLDTAGNLCRAGNCAPAWTRVEGTDMRQRITYRYKVAAEWARNLWRDYKLDDSVYEEYLYLCRDKLAANKRNFELFRTWKRERDLCETIQERTHRIQNNPAIYTPFATVPEAKEWLDIFAHDALRYPILLVHAPSFAGKSEWAVSLFTSPLYLEIGAASMWPAGMKKLDRTRHDGLVLDDLRDLDFLAKNQEKLQGKYNRPVELFNTPGGELAITIDLYRLPMVFTINNSTANLDLLNTHDFCSKSDNVWVFSFSGRPGDSPPLRYVP